MRVNRPCKNVDDPSLKVHLHFEAIIHEQPNLKRGYFHIDIARRKATDYHIFHVEYHKIQATKIMPTYNNRQAPLHFAR